ncbi:PTS sugar transporter [Paenibacillus selenitireducens]|uniref:PTS sugar transporter n=1 Tax=Paenibacillus selenitireducens TaxID=1324314 RepID=A0A1T2XJN2_9BACL|nr:N-acetylglucosamine-specific PTS transporter subunit IIBC [Paenibacillus selenitireducens]OPA80089.1 PTS sugar transporter [Paenibacillus selenitireducens]
MLAFLQRVGKSLMLPVATLPAAAILNRFGAIDYIKDFHLGDSVGGFLNQYVAPFLAAGGGAIFDNLALIFAVGVAIGFAADAVAALSAVISYLVLTNVLGKMPTAFEFIGKDTKLDMGVIGGIIAGGIAAFFYNRYHNIKLPDWLGFFSGKRFVPIITSLAMVLVGIVFGLIWGPVQGWLDTFGNWVVGLGAIGSGVFGTANRLLVPFGLHHVINSIAWFQIGSFTDAAGNVVHGDIHRFFAGDPNTGQFMTGFFPIMMFALPGAALAFIHTAKPEKKKLVASTFVGLAFASFLTGITEPIEFAFMFIAPVLYVVHAILTGVAGVIMNLLDVRLGFGFSAGLIDYLVNIQLSKNAWILLPVGAVFFLVYYFLFRILIVKLNLKTPGREDDDETADSNVPAGAANSPLSEKAVHVLGNLGGKENIVSTDACITRLRLVVKDDKQVNDAELKKLGAAGVMRLGGGAVQVVFGTQSEMLKDEINKKL